MPMATPEEQREYQRKWIARRRAEWLVGKACVDCGSSENLTIDHRDPTQKIHHRVWSWRLERREAELAKCDVRCDPCHRERHAKERRHHGLGRYQKGCRCDVCKAAKSAALKRETRRQPKRREWGTIPQNPEAHTVSSGAASPTIAVSP